MGKIPNEEIMIKINDKEYTGFWATTLAIVVAGWALLLTSLIILFTGAMILLPVLIPLIIVKLLMGAM